MDKFNEVITNFVNKSKEQMLNITKDAIQEVIIDMQTPVKKGGKMRVKTGFLRHSGVSALNAFPEGEIVGRSRNKDDPKEGELPEYKMEENGVSASVIKTLLNMKIGDKFVYGWTAKYANIREIYDGFLVSATDKWQQIVEKVSK